MKFCVNHWAKLRAAIVERGLDGLIAKSAEEAASRTMAELEAGPSRTTFDPLMYAHNAILSNVLDLAGLPVMMDNEDGTDRCPLCYMISHCRCGRGDGCEFNTWIHRAADDARECALELGLVGRA